MTHMRLALSHDSHETGVVQHLCDDLYLSLFVVRNLEPEVEGLDHPHSDLLPLHLTDVVVWLSDDLKRIAKLY